jgi:hypothetical protein
VPKLTQLILLRLKTKQTQKKIRINFKSNSNKDHFPTVRTFQLVNKQIKIIKITKTQLFNPQFRTNKFKTTESTLIFTNTRKKDKLDSTCKQIVYKEGNCLSIKFLIIKDIRLCNKILITGCRHQTIFLSQTI